MHTFIAHLLSYKSWNTSNWSKIGPGNALIRYLVVGVKNEAERISVIGLCKLKWRATPQYCLQQIHGGSRDLWIIFF
jgi:hypothetical protein